MLKDKLFEALSSAQAEYPRLMNDVDVQERFQKKDKSGKVIKTDTYASLDAILSEPIRKINAKYGLCVTIRPDFLDDGSEIFIVTLGHSSGQEISSRARAIGNANPNKQFEWGGANTYVTRYMVKNILGLSDKGDQQDQDETKFDKPEQKQPKITPYVHVIQPKAETPIALKQQEPEIIEFITREQEDELQRALVGHKDIMQTILTGFGISQSRQIPKDRYKSTMNRIEQIKEAKKDMK